ncbi:carboxylesterase/lipase family protein [Phytomonospora endophytica]|uniref:Carboxylic ester hydrolase n=1 Tax=Phytomonospora endophytica TaxID=714109 RepID=A0A841FI64_9ACTN|nr:carboxylesterase family protein [Phytomonospora endophytica]MBB6035554.1 para-nitrobenzyl esterase [Phytomonospora endophytica]GIG70083.1 carboxylic ester hydrolase [Phytomonospora endophytica]
MLDFTTTSGRVRGREAAPGVTAALGIPYAAAPFGAFRFLAPRRPGSWDGVREANAFGPISPQSAALPGAPAWAPGDVDILTVNVWTPGGPNDGMPVVVWIHGGAYTFGSSAQPDFDGTALARLGIVVVTLNYRLGFEGFGHVSGGLHPDNRGLLDQVAALTWVHANIAAFGGDPGNVTVAGQSSGAASAAALAVMPAARGLFGRAILHSVASPFYETVLARETARLVAASAGVTAEAKSLLAAPPETLVAAGDRVAASYREDPGSGWRHYDPVLYAPIVDDATMPVDPLSGIADADVGLLVCSTADEYWLLHAVGSAKDVTTDDGLASFVKDYGLPGDIVDGYRAFLPGADVRDIYLAIYGDQLFGEYGARLAAGAKRAHLARFERRREGVRPWHCADVPFAFGTIGDPALDFLIGGPPDDADRDLSARMTRAWADFAATGDPGWDPVGADGGPVRLWHSGSGPDLGEAAPTRRLWSGVGFAAARS